MRDLTEKEMLAIAARNGDRQAQTALVKEYESLVGSIARSFPYLDRDDAMNIGRLAVIRAAGNYDPSRCDRFLPVVKTAIIGALKNASVKEKGFSTRNGRKAFFMVAKTRAALRGQGIEDSDANVADALGISVSEIEAVTNRMRPVVDLDNATALTDAKQNPHDCKVRKDRIEKIRRAIEAFRPYLSEVEKAILDYHLCPADDKDYTLEEIAEYLYYEGITPRQLSRQRLHQVKGALIEKLAFHFADCGLDRE